jgi:hypothetical protein
VKNIAEKLFKQRINFRLLVSKEFHFEWSVTMRLPAAGSDREIGTSIYTKSCQKVS